MSYWHTAAQVGELDPGQMKRFRAAGKRLLLCRSDDAYYAVDEMCSHEDFSLYLGCIQDGKIKCSLHGSYFDLKSGAALTEPADESLNTYEVKIENGRVLVWVE